MPESAKSPYGQQCLTLPAAPFPLEVHIQDPHDECVPACRPDSTSSPSFLNFNHVLRAAIREMTHPREPSRNPRCSAKLLNQFHGVASHIAARQLRFPAAHICCAA